MDFFSHIQEIKLIATLAIGYFCYRKINSQIHSPSLQEMFSDQSQSYQNDDLGAEQAPPQVLISAPRAECVDDGKDNHHMDEEPQSEMNNIQVYLKNGQANETPSSYSKVTLNKSRKRYIWRRLKRGKGSCNQKKSMKKRIKKSRKNQDQRRVCL